MSRTLLRVLLLRLGLAACMFLPTIAQAQELSLEFSDTYLMDRQLEIDLARSAAPASVSGEATVLVLLADGEYEVAVHGTNSFTCYLGRSWTGPAPVKLGRRVLNRAHFDPTVIAPMCLNATASASVLPWHRLTTRLLFSGQDTEQVEDAVQSALASGDLLVPPAGAMAYMMSPRQFLNPVVRRWRPHLMFYTPYATSAAAFGLRGISPVHPFVTDEGGPWAISTVPLVQFSDGAPGELGPTATDAEPTKANDKYASKETQHVVERMLAAHGGLEPWRDAPALRWDRVHERYGADGSMGERLVMREHVEQGSRRIYHEWPEDDAYIVIDGEEIWAVNWTNPLPVRLVAGTGFYLGNLAWVNQDPSVRLGDVERVENLAPDMAGPFLSVRMTFDFNDDEMTLFIDPETYRLRGAYFYFTDPDFLRMVGAPAGTRRLGPNLFVIDTYVEEGGLLLTGKYHAYSPRGHVSARGEYSKWRTDVPFDHLRLERPATAVVVGSGTATDAGRQQER